MCVMIVKTTKKQVLKIKERSKGNTYKRKHFRTSARLISVCMCSFALLNRYIRKEINKNKEQQYVEILKRKRRWQMKRDGCVFMLVTKKTAATCRGKKLNP